MAPQGFNPFSTWSTPLSGLAVALLVILAAFMTRRKRHHFHPGPAGLPVVGNLLDVPKENPWSVYQEWSRKYKSPVVHMEVLGTHILIVNTAKAAKDIFEKRSQIYSDKPTSVMVNELTGWEKSFGVMPYGNEWRLHRKMFDQHFRAASIPSYHPQMLKQADVLVDALANSPDDFFKHIRYMAGALILGVVYGLEIESRDDPALVIAEEAVYAFSETADAGSYLVEYVPILKYIPEWFPGAGFKRQAAQWKKTVDSMFDTPYQLVRKNMSVGVANASITAALLSEYNVMQDTTNMGDVIRNVGGAGYSAGSDTTILTLYNFVLAMVTHPEVQRMAHKELDLVIEQGGLPVFEDRDALPCVTAILKEVLRWRPPLPQALPHRSTTDDTYEGFFIPSGSIMFGNSWAILHDESRYPHAHAFDPSRFLTADGRLDPSVPDPIEAFGFGRRICPGRHFVTDAAWIAIARILAVFSVEKAVDETGSVVEPSGLYDTSGIFSWPKPFRAAFRRRRAAS